MNAIKPGINSKRATEGERVSAREWNRLRFGIIAARGGIAVTLGQRRPWSESMIHQIVNMTTDLLVCHRVWRGGTLGSEEIYVALPPLLRQSVTSRDGVTYTYIDLQTRTASKAGESDETQIITPNYLVGDLVEVEITRGLTGVPDVDQQRGRPIDKNVDARAWATVPPPP